MVHAYGSTHQQPSRHVDTLFAPPKHTGVTYPIQSVAIDWERLIATRPFVLGTVNTMPGYLLKPEVLTLLDVEKHPSYRLILDLMWSTGGRISEILAVTPASFCREGKDFGVVFKPTKDGPGRPSNQALLRRPRRYVPIIDEVLIDRIESYLRAGTFRPNERIFPVVRQTVNRHISKLIEDVGGAPFHISAHTFRHSFAIHLLLHGRPLSYVAQVLGHKSVDSSEIYTKVLTIDGGNFLRGVDFH